MRAFRRLTRLFRPGTGLSDINGVHIREGDDVVVYPLRHAVIADHTPPFEPGPRVLEVDPRRPLPVADVPLAHGVVYWDEEQLALRVRFTNKSHATKLAGCRLGGGDCAFEVIL